MGDRTDIEWSDATWNPLLGCRRVSPGCGDGKGGGCYAERQAARMAGPGGRYEGIVRSTPTGPRWTGASRLVVEVLDQPLRWKRPRRIFVDSMADLFFEGHSNEDIAAVFGVMAACPQHTFQVLTKRPERAREWFQWVADVNVEVIALAACNRFHRARALNGILEGVLMRAAARAWPLPNVWLGVSAENQETADERIPLLLETPAAVRFVSYEPALGPVEFQRERGWLDMYSDAHHFLRGPGHTRIDWIIAGSESGPRARPAELEWFRSVRDQCAAAGVSFFFKQWVGPWIGPSPHGVVPVKRKVSLPVLDGRQHAEFPR